MNVKIRARCWGCNDILTLEKEFETKIVLEQEYNLEYARLPIELADSLVGTKIKCPSCGYTSTFTIGWIEAECGLE